MSGISNGGVLPAEPVETKKTSVLSWLGKNYLAVILAIAMVGIITGFAVFVIFHVV
jgi:hypothetical protein